jgi:hypothetical protein
LPEAVGYSVYDALLTDESDLTDLMDTEPTGERNEWGHQMVDYTAESWERARATLARYGVDIGPHRGSLGLDTNLVSLAKRRLGSSRQGGNRGVTAIAEPGEVVAYLCDRFAPPEESSTIRPPSHVLPSTSWKGARPTACTLAGRRRHPRSSRGAEERLGGLLGKGE